MCGEVKGQLGRGGSRFYSSSTQVDCLGQKLGSKHLFLLSYLAGCHYSDFLFSFLTMNGLKRRCKLQLPKDYMCEMCVHNIYM